MITKSARKLRTGLVATESLVHFTVRLSESLADLAKWSTQTKKILGLVAWLFIGSALSNPVGAHASEPFKLVLTHEEISAKSFYFIKASALHPCSSEIKLSEYLEANKSHFTAPYGNTPQARDAIFSLNFLLDGQSAIGWNETKKTATDFTLKGDIWLPMAWITTEAKQGHFRADIDKTYKFIKNNNLNAFFLGLYAGRTDIDWKKVGTDIAAGVVIGGVLGAASPFVAVVFTVGAGIYMLQQVGSELASTFNDVMAAETPEEAFQLGVNKSSTYFSTALGFVASIPMGALAFKWAGNSLRPTVSKLTRTLLLKLAQNAAKAVASVQTVSKAVAARVASAGRSKSKAGGSPKATEVEGTSPAAEEGGVETTDEPEVATDKTRSKALKTQLEATRAYQEWLNDLASIISLAKEKMQGRAQVTINNVKWTSTEVDLYFDAHTKILELNFKWFDEAGIFRGETKASYRAKPDASDRTVFEFLRETDVSASAIPFKGDSYLNEIQGKKFPGVELPRAKDFQVQVTANATPESPRYPRSEKKDSPAAGNPLARLEDAFNRAFANQSSVGGRYRSEVKKIQVKPTAPDKPNEIHVSVFYDHYTMDNVYFHTSVFTKEIRVDPEFVSTGKIKFSDLTGWWFDRIAEGKPEYLSPAELADVNSSYFNPNVIPHDNALKIVLQEVSNTKSVPKLFESGGRKFDIDQCQYRSQVVRTKEASASSLRVNRPTDAFDKFKNKLENGPERAKTAAMIVADFKRFLRWRLFGESFGPKRLPPIQQAAWDLVSSISEISIPRGQEKLLLKGSYKPGRLQSLPDGPSLQAEVAKWFAAAYDGAVVQVTVTPKSKMPTPVGDGTLDVSIEIPGEALVKIWNKWVTEGAEKVLSF